MKFSRGTRSVAALVLVFGLFKASSVLAVLPACGQPLQSGTYKGVAAKSNGQYQATGNSCGGRGTYGLQYQCVEYIRRFYSQALGVDTSKWGGINAVDFFSNASNLKLLAFPNGSAFRPQPDDILVFSGDTYGHIAIVSSVTSNSITIVEQNWSETGSDALGLTKNTDGTYTVNRRRLSNGTFSSYQVLGWLRKPYSFRIDNFKVIKNNTLFFEDTFSDGRPPPSAPNFPSGTAASYSVFGTFGPESGGKLTIDSSGAAVVGSVVPTSSFFAQRARLLTNTDSSNLSLGLKIDDTFSVTGIFDLVVPPEGRLTGYAIELTDRSSSSVGNDSIRLHVRRIGSNAATVSFAHADETAHTFTNLGSILLNTSHQQIALTLSRPSTANNQIVASFAYIDGGAEGPTTTFFATADIFRGENFTRTEFFVESQLP